MSEEVEKEAVVGTIGEEPEGEKQSSAEGLVTLHGGDEETQELDQDSIVALPGSEPAATRGLSGGGFTFRWDWGYKRGLWTLYLGSRYISARSRVFVSVSEGHMGAARYRLYNVVPYNNGVAIKVYIGWWHPIRLYADYLVINP